MVLRSLNANGPWYATIVYDKRRSDGHRRFTATYFKTINGIRLPTRSSPALANPL